MPVCFSFRMPPGRKYRYGKKEYYEEKLRDGHVQRPDPWKTAHLYDSADLFRNPTASVQRCGCDRCGTFRGQPVSGGGGFHNGADQPDDQYLYRTVRGCQCHRGEILRSEAGKRRAGYDPYGHGTQHRQRSFSDHCGSASLETNAGTHGNPGRCDR